ncbi:MAG: hypothetical protein JW876_00170 [Candidatus Krumholzibacteriota bacterium]|nr:hypothetical protein [Candidatus Krumholzibacteriota bacterium]
MKRLSFCTTLVLLVSLAGASLAPALGAVRQDHPRIWLTDERIAALNDRMNRNTTNAHRLESWCDSHMGDALSGYIDSRAIGMLKAVNYALMYQLDPASNGRYAQRAVQIIEYAFDNPYSSYTLNTWLAYDNYYLSRYLMSSVAITVDWCYDWLAANRPDALARFSNQLDAWATTIMTGAGFAWNDPSNNFYYGHMWALLTSGYALYGDNPDAELWLARARDVMLPEAIHYTRGEQIPWYTWDNRTGRAKGGMWNEGTAYGNVDNELISSTILAVQSAEGIAGNEYEEFVWPDEVIRFYLHATYPTGDHLIAEGDDTGQVPLNPKVRVPLLFMVHLSDSQWKNYGQYWLNNNASQDYYDYKLYNEFIWYDDRLGQVDYRSALADSNFYYLEGTQILLYRSGWGPNDTWASFRAGVNNTDHGLNGFGNFILYRGGYLATDKAPELDDRFLESDVHHNCLYIPLESDRKLFWGASTIKHRRETGSYYYFAADLSGPYLAQPDYRDNVVEHKEREFFLLTGEGSVVVMDRGRSYDEGRQKYFQVYTHTTAVPDGPDYRMTNGSADMVIHTAWPQGSEVTRGIDTYGMPRFRAYDPSPDRTETFLHVMKTAAAGGPFTSVAVTPGRPDLMVGAAFGSDIPQLGYLVAFSNAIDGATPGDAVDFTFARPWSTLRLYAMNLAPNATYYVSLSTTETTATVGFSRSFSASAQRMTTNEDGILFAQIPLGEAPAPPATPEKKTIDQ